MSCPTNGHETRIAQHFVLPRLRFAPVGAEQAPLAPSVLKTPQIIYVGVRCNLEKWVTPYLFVMPQSGSLASFSVFPSS